MSDQAPEQHRAFLSYLRSIDVDRHILKGKRGSEENVKIKIVVPLLQALAWDLLTDMDFERRGADMVLHSGGKPAIVVEVKSWGEGITGYLDQCLEYCLKLGTPWVVITSGHDTAVYSSLLDAEDLLATEPLYRFSFDDLLGDRGETILEQLASLIGKAAFTAGHEGLSSRVEERLGIRDLYEAWNEFDEQAADFEADIKTRRLSADEYLALAEKHSEPVSRSLKMMYEGMLSLADLDERIRVGHREKSIGLWYRLDTQPRTKMLGLAGAYPDSAHVSFGLVHWRRANLPERLYKQLEQYPRQVGSEEWAEGLLELLRQAILEIT